MSPSRLCLSVLTAEDGGALEFAKGPVGLGFVVVLGIVLLAASVHMRAKGKHEIRPADLALFIVPFVVWLLMSGQVKKFAFAGVEVEVRDAILDAAGASVENQVTSVGDVIHEISSANSGAKGGFDVLQELVERRVEALEFRLGRGGYYVGGAIAQYFEVLSQQPSFKYVVIYDESGNLFGMFPQQDLVDELMGRFDGFKWVAETLNASDARARLELAQVAGFVGGELAITPGTSKQAALSRMETEDVPLLPIIDPERGFVGVVERSRLTASLLLDISESLERL